MQVTWVDGQGAEQVRELTINALEPTELGEDLPAGTVVTITEGDRPGIDTVVWSTITISGNDVTDAGDGSATLVVSDQQDDVTLVTIVNEATWAPGTLSVAKTVTGVDLGNPDVPDSVTVVASWADEDSETGVASRELTVPTDGTVVALGEDLPYGTEVTLTEVTPQDGDAFTWDAPVWGGDATIGEDGSVVVTIGAATVAEVTLTNHATATLGSLALTKVLAGDGAGLVPAQTRFPVTITWTDLLGATQSVSAELTTQDVTVIDGIPVATPVRIVEAPADTPDTVTWSGVEWASQSDGTTVTADADGVTVTVTGEVGTVAHVTATNTFAAVPDLPGTGLDGSVAAIIAIAAIVLLGTGAALVIRKRRS